MIAKQYFKMFFWLFLVALLYLTISNPRCDAEYSKQ